MNHGVLRGILTACVLFSGVSVQLAAGSMAPAPPTGAAKAKLVELNSAPKAKLMTLPGITADLADKIIAGRPYHSKADIAARKIVTLDAYQKQLRTLVRVQPPGVK